MLSAIRKTSQPTLDGLLAGGATLNPVQWLVDAFGNVHDCGSIHLLAHDANPADRLRSQSRIQGPGEHTTSPQWEQQLVAISAHPATTACCGDQQMHKRLLPLAGGNGLHTISSLTS